MLAGLSGVLCKRIMDFGVLVYTLFSNFPTTRRKRDFHTCSDLDLAHVKYCLRTLMLQK